MAIGKKTGGGSRLGKQNKLTKSVKEAFELAFNQLQTNKDAKLSVWAANNPTEFYKLAAKLIPTALTGEVQTTGIIKVVRE